MDVELLFNARPDVGAGWGYIIALDAFSIRRG